MTERTPSTEAGKSLLADVHGDDHGFGYDIDRDAILAIENEAESSLRARLAAEVRALPMFRTYRGGGPDFVPSESTALEPWPYIPLTAVLAVIKGQEPPRA